MKAIWKAAIAVGALTGVAVATKVLATPENIKKAKKVTNKATDAIIENGAKAIIVAKDCAVKAMAIGHEVYLGVKEKAEEFGDDIETCIDMIKQERRCCDCEDNFYGCCTCCDYGCGHDYDDDIDEDEFESCESCEGPSCQHCDLEGCNNIDEVIEKIARMDDADIDACGSQEVMEGFADEDSSDAPISDIDELCDTDDADEDESEIDELDEHDYEVTAEPVKNIEELMQETDAEPENGAK